MGGSLGSAADAAADFFLFPEGPSRCELAVPAKQALAHCPSTKHIDCMVEAYLVHTQKHLLYFETYKTKLKKLYLEKPENTFLQGILM